MRKSDPFLGILIILHSILTATGRHHFESTVHPGFKVTSAQIGDYDFPQCLIPLTPQCYTDNASSHVNFKIMDTKEVTALEFLGSGGANANFKVLPPGSSAEAKGIAVSGNVIVQQRFPLPFVPKKMVPIKNGLYGTPIHTNSADICDAESKRDCIAVVEETSHIKVMAAIDSDPVSVTFYGKGKSWRINFLPGSAYSCLTQTLTLLITNLLLAALFS